MITRKRFLLLRHGQTDFNAGKVSLPYHGDAPLNEVGEGQALGVRDFIGSLGVGSICHSPLLRARQTMEISTDGLVCDRFEISHLQECSMEVWCEMVRGDIGAGIVRDFIGQVVQGVNLALEKDGPVLLVAHGGVHWAICHQLEVSNHDWDLGNCEVAEFSPHEDGSWVAKNLTFH